MSTRELMRLDVPELVHRLQRTECEAEKNARQIASQSETIRKALGEDWQPGETITECLTRIRAGLANYQERLQHAISREEMWAAQRDEARSQLAAERKGAIAREELMENVQLLFEELLGHYGELDPTGAAGFRQDAWWIKPKEEVPAE